MKYVTLCCYIGEFPRSVKTLFFWRVVLKKLMNSPILNIFQKFQKEVLDEYHGHLSTFCDFSISAVFGSKIFEKWKRGPHFHFSKIFDPKTTEIEKSQNEVICPWYSSNTSFWIFWKILRFREVINFLRTTRQKKSVFTLRGIPLNNNTVQQRLDKTFVSVWGFPSNWHTV